MKSRAFLAGLICVTVASVRSCDFNNDGVGPDSRDITIVFEVFARQPRREY